MSVEVVVTLSDSQVEQIAERAARLVTDRAQADAPTWLNTERAAKYIDAPTSRIHDLVGLHKLNPRRDGRRLLFKRAELDEYLDESA